MISLPGGSRIWLVTGVTDMRNGFNDLASRVQNILNDDPFSGHLFIKRLEHGHFVWPSISDSKIHLTAAQLAMLLEGLNWKHPSDDTPVRVLEPGNGKTRTGRLWVYVRDDRNAGLSEPPAVWFSYSADRKGEHPQRHLAGYRGVLQADAYGGYDALYESGRITEAACMAHARRKIHDEHVRRSTALTDEALKRIAALAEIHGSPAEERLAVRKERSLPQMESLHDWIQTQMKCIISL